VWQIRTRPYDKVESRTMSASFGSQPERLTAAYRRLRRLGFDDPAVADLTAVRSGFAIGSQPWRVRELTYLLFLRDLAGTRGEWSGAEDRASNRIGDRWRLPARAPRYLDTSDGSITLLTLFQAAASRPATLDRLAPMPLRLPSASPEPPREGG
jgi:hypothetical protein